jgi:hypothetical protein
MAYYALNRQWLGAFWHEFVGSGGQQHSQSTRDTGRPCLLFIYSTTSIIFGTRQTPPRTLASTHPFVADQIPSSFMISGRLCFCRKGQGCLCGVGLALSHRCDHQLEAYPLTYAIAYHNATIC